MKMKYFKIGVALGFCFCGLACKHTDNIQKPPNSNVNAITQKYVPPDIDSVIPIPPGKKYYVELNGKQYEIKDKHTFTFYTRVVSKEEKELISKDWSEKIINEEGLIRYLDFSKHKIQ